MSSSLVHNQLRLAREAAGLTQQQLADAVGVTRQTIGLIERGDYNPTVRLGLLLAAELKTSIGELFWLGKASAVSTAKELG